jgi:hypothetical protein
MSATVLMSKTDEDRALAERRYDACLKAWREARRRKTLLVARGVVEDAEGREHPVNDVVERDILEREFDNEQGAAALSLKEAREDYLAARVAQARVP